MAELVSGPEGQAAGRDPLVGALVGFARELRAAGLAIGSGDAAVYCAAMTGLDPDARPHGVGRRGAPA